MKVARTWRLLAVSPVLAAPLWWFAFNPKVGLEDAQVYQIGHWDRAGATRFDARAECVTRALQKK
ncbi:MAG TPA: hypothetical protein VGM29_03105 [Polyangiaceae bacterium]|jgi:hypothetical protein